MIFENEMKWNENENEMKMKMKWKRKGKVFTDPVMVGYLLHSQFYSFLVLTLSSCVSWLQLSGFYCSSSCSADWLQFLPSSWVGSAASRFPFVLLIPDFSAGCDIHVAALPVLFPEKTFVQTLFDVELC